MNYEDFSVRSPLDGTTCHCRFHTLTTGITPRHSDTVDVRFLVNGQARVVALPHAALAEHRRTTGRALTDREVIQIAGLFLQEMIERAERLDEPFLSVSHQQTLELTERIASPVPR